MSFDLIAALQQVFTSHGFASTAVPSGLTFSNPPVQIVASVFHRGNPRNQQSIQLDISIQSPRLGGRTLIESFAGWGSTESEAISHAFHKFMQCSLHVFLDVFFSKASEQVEIESWQGNGTEWRVCMGPLLLQYFQDSRVELNYGQYLDELRQLALPRLQSECHWIRVFFMRKGNQTDCSEVLFDNEDWPEAREFLQNRNWPEGAYLARNFMMVTRT